MMPRLQAEEQIAAINSISIGAGTMPKRDRQRLAADLDKRAAGAKRRAARPTPAVLATMGIVVVEAPSKAAQVPLEGENTADRDPTRGEKGRSPDRDRNNA